MKGANSFFHKRVKVFLKLLSVSSEHNM